MIKKSSFKNFTRLSFSINFIILPGIGNCSFQALTANTLYLSVSASQSCSNFRLIRIRFQIVVRLPALAE